MRDDVTAMTPVTTAMSGQQSYADCSPDYSPKVTPLADATFRPLGSVNPFSTIGEHECCCHE